MDDSRQYQNELREVRALVERIKGGKCVLVLGPRIDIGADDPDRTPFDELLARELLDSIGEPAGRGPANLRRAADLYLRQCQDLAELHLPVVDFYRRYAGATTPFHRDLAALPFHLCLSASPTDLMLNAFEAAGKKPQRGYYKFVNGEPTPPPLAQPNEMKPLVYHLFGHCDDPASLVLTEGDLIEFLVAVVKGEPKMPDQVRARLADNNATFLFFGFGFQNWYLRVLLHVLKMYGHESKAVAFEDKQFFDHPDREQTVGFFSGPKRRIDFRQLRWEELARQLREVYEAAAPKAAPAAAAAPSREGKAPTVFLSYASEDRDTVNELAEQLESRGIDVWQDVQDLRGGDDWSRALFDIINRQADYFVVVQTPAMTSRVEGVFHSEIAAARQRQSKMGELDGTQLRFIIPLRIGDCPLLSSVSALHAIDGGTPEGIDALVQSIQEDWQRRARMSSRKQEAA